MKENIQALWMVDPVHSEVQFKVKHLAISNITGSFTAFKGSLATDNGNFDNAHVNFEIDTESVSTKNVERDQHLKSDAFFNSAKFPKIIFSGFLNNVNDELQLNGDVTMLEITKKISLSAEMTGMGKGRFGDERAGFEFNGHLNRKDYGLNFGLLTEKGNLIVGENIKLHFDIQLIKKEN